MKVYYLIPIILLASPALFANGNESIASFSKAKRLMERQVYNQLPKKTLYCGGAFNSKKKVTDSNGFSSAKYKKRSKKIEWEHVVPAENFGRSFAEWREGHKECVTKKGKPFKGRNCASKMNTEYRYMQSDMNNLYPAIGAVNALRSNYRFGMLKGKGLGDCAMVIDSSERKVMPPIHSRGIVARVNLYFAEAYPRYNLSNSQRKLFVAWDKQFPVTADECKRNKLIEEVQGNTNKILQERCFR